MKIDEVMLTEEEINEVNLKQAGVAAGIIMAILTSGNADAAGLGKAQDYFKDYAVTHVSSDGMNMNNLMNIFQKGINSSPELKKKFNGFMKMIPNNVKQALRKKQREMERQQRKREYEARRDQQRRDVDARKQQRQQDRLPSPPPPRYDTWTPPDANNPNVGSI